MTLNTKITIPESKQSPIEGDFLWVSDIQEHIQEILEINQWDYDEQVIELVNTIFPWCWEWFSKRENGSIVKTFWIWKYIRLIEKHSNTIEIDMIQLEGNWIQGMLEIFVYCIENNYSTIVWKVQPQRRPSPRRKKILYDFYSNFWFSWNDGTNISFPLTQENKKVLVNKIKYYLENWKWFQS